MKCTTCGSRRGEYSEEGDVWICECGAEWYVGVVLTPGQYKTQTAYKFDPVLNKHVRVVQPEFVPRRNGERYAGDLMPTQTYKRVDGSFWGVPE